MAKALRSFRRCLALEPSEPLAEDASCRLESSRLPPGSGATDALRGLPIQLEARSLLEARLVVDIETLDERQAVVGTAKLFHMFQIQ